jgi:hypothetical protein
MFTKPAFPTPVNRALTLYVHAIREYYEKKRVEGFVWTDTRDNIANALTKFSQAGLLEVSDLRQFYSTASWEPVHPFRWHSEKLIDPEPLKLTVFRDPPPPTRVMADKVIDITPEDPSDIYRQGSSKTSETLVTWSTFYCTGLANVVVSTQPEIGTDCTVHSDAHISTCNFSYRTEKD